MFSVELIPGFIMGIREGLEAFLIIAIMLEYLNKTNKWNELMATYSSENYIYQVRDKQFSIPLTTRTLAGNAIPKIALPKYRSAYQKISS